MAGLYTGMPLLAEPETAELLLGIIAENIGRFSANDLQQWRAEKMAAATQSPLPSQDGQGGAGVGVIEMFGPIERRPSCASMITGGTSIEEMQAAFDGMMADPRIGAIVMQVDSPGGSSSGVQEFSRRIYEARGKKPIFAVADTAANSAAYYLASSASKFYASDSAAVGSIGVYMTVVDQTQALEKQGMKVHVVKSGRFKAELHPGQPVAQESLDYLQGVADEVYAQFVADVARNRGVSKERVIADYGEGRVLSASEASKRGMVDGIKTFDEVLQEAYQAAGAKASKPNARQRMQHEHRWRELAIREL